MDTETNELMKKINMAPCYYLAGQAVIFHLEGIDIEEMYNESEDDDKNSCWVLPVKRRLSYSYILNNPENLFLRGQVEKIVRGVMAGYITRARYFSRIVGVKREDWLEEFMEKEDEELLRNYFEVLTSPHLSRKGDLAFAKFLSVQAGNLVDQNWVPIIRIAHDLYSRKRVDRKKVEAIIFLEENGFEPPELDSIETRINPHD